MFDQTYGSVVWLPQVLDALVRWFIAFDRECVETLVFSVQSLAQRDDALVVLITLHGKDSLIVAI